MIENYAATTRWDEDSTSTGNWFEVDFSTPGEFVKYGLATEYYEGGLAYLISSFPYDSSWQEKREWYSGLTLCDKFLFHNILSSSNGVGVFSGSGWGTQVALHGGRFGEPTTKEYIKFFGGPNNSEQEFDTSNILNLSQGRGSNLKFGRENTVEFFLKRTKNSNVLGTTLEECILDVRNNAEYGDAGFGGFFIHVVQVADNSPAVLSVLAMSGLNSAALTTGDIEPLGDGEWHHYAVVLRSGPVITTISVYVDGEEAGSQETPLVLDEVEMNLVGFIGASQGRLLDYPLGSLKLNGEIDDFRFWQKVRTKEEIKIFSRTCVYGGTNDSDENIGLGVYYKFNEGITGMVLKDSIVLDYSGRRSNGGWVGYSASSRRLGSAITEGGFGEYEQKDTSQYEEEPSYLSLVSEYRKKGEDFDLKNQHNIFKQMPRWLSINNLSSSKDLRYLSHVIGSFFDTLLLIGYNVVYAQGQDYSFGGLVKPEYNFSFLSSFGLKVNDLLDNVTWSEFAIGANEQTSFETTVEGAKRIILGNLANELDLLLKSKGTKRSIDSVLRCFGTAEDAIHPVLFEVGREVEFSDKYKAIAQRRSVANCSSELNVGAVITHSFDTAQSPLITGVSQDPELYNMTFQCRFVVPANYFGGQTKFSVFGVHGATFAGGACNWTDASTDSFIVYVEKASNDSTSGRFVLELRHTSGTTENFSDWFDGVFSGSSWVLNVSFVNKNSSQFGMLTDGIMDVPVAPNYEVVFSGAENHNGSIRGEFSNSVAVHAGLVPEFLSADKGAFAGSHRIDFVGDIDDLNEDYTCCLFDSVIAWSGTPTAEETRLHALSFRNRGIGYFEDVNRYVQQDLSQNLRFLDWQFGQELSVVPHVTLGFVSGEFDDARVVCQEISGGADMNAELHPFRCYLFGEPTVSGCFSSQYVFAKEQVPPEVFSDTESVSCGNNYDLEVFAKRPKWSKKIFGIEKNMNFLLNRLIFDLFGGIKYVYNLFSDGYQKHEIEYYRLRPAAERFFEEMNNEYLDFDRFFEYFRWLDGSIGDILSFFATSAFSAKKDGQILRNVVSSHALEREKYWWKRVVPDFLENNFEAVALGAEFNDYNWKIGHYKSGDVNFDQTLFWSERANRSLAEISSGSGVVDASRESIRVAAIGGEAPSYLLSSRKRPYILLAAGQSTAGGVQSEIEMYSLANSVVLGELDYNLAPPIDLDPAAGILRESVGLPSRTIGNFSKNYQVVCSSGRSRNNLSMKRSKWQFTFELPSFAGPRIFLETAYGFFTRSSSCTTSESYGFPRECDRKATDSIVVTCFSSPGDRTTSEGFRDRESLESCSYNSVNCRNLAARHDLDEEWSL